MIAGTINSVLEPMVPIEVLGPTGRTLDVDALLDTGFGGFLTLTPQQVTALGLPWTRRDAGTLADGTVQLFDVYAADVVWDGGIRRIEVQSIDAQHLLGMSLLFGHDVFLRVVSGGPVTISTPP